jgi:hypothetical protein
MNSTPWYDYVIGAPFVAALLWAWCATAQDGRKVKRYKIIRGQRVRDYAAERQLTRDTTPPR